MASLGSRHASSNSIGHWSISFWTPAWLSHVMFNTEGMHRNGDDYGVLLEKPSHLQEVSARGLMQLPSRCTSRLVLPARASLPGPDVSPW